MSIILINPHLRHRSISSQCFSRRTSPVGSTGCLFPSPHPRHDHAICLRLRCAASTSSVNGYPLPSQQGNDDLDDEERRRRSRIRDIFEFFPSVLPGGKWWRFSEEARIKFNAKPITIWRALSRMWQLIDRDRWIIFAAFTALVIAAVSEISIPHFLTSSIFSAKEADVAVFHRNVQIMVILCVVSSICSGLRGLLFSIANMVIVKRMRETLYTTLLSQDISFFDEETVGDLTSRLGSDCQQVSRVLGSDINIIFRNVLQGTGALIYLFMLSWPLGLATFVICGGLAAVMTKYGSYQKKGAKLSQDCTASANMVGQEALSLIRTVRVYGSETFEAARYKTWLDKLADVTMRQSAAYGLWNFSFNILYHSTQIAAVLIGGFSILSGSITAEQLTKYILYSEWLIYSTWFIGDNVSSLMQSIGASEKVFQMMDLPPAQQFTSQGKKLEKLTGRIDLVDMSFSYVSRPEVSVLKSINLTIRAGEVVAIVGLSGSGKSTLANLLLRLYDPTSGQILFDGISIKDLEVKWLRENIGYVGQEPKLFRLDVRSNISYGSPGPVSEEQIEWAAKQAYAHEFICELPEGYSTLVDDELLSGGQKQRIAIARAILRDPKILVLDEATSALDAQSERNVKAVIHSIKHSDASPRTVIVIAHRLSTIQAADRIVVMDNAAIVQMGTHEELMLSDGIYKRLVKNQADALS